MTGDSKMGQRKIKVDSEVDSEGGQPKRLVREEGSHELRRAKDE